MPSASTIPNRLVHPLRRKGKKADARSGEADWRDTGAWERIGWEDALDIVAEAFVKAEANSAREAVWPYYYAGTMGLVQRDGINRLRHAKRYSGEFDTICTGSAWPGFIAGTGRLAGPDPREMAPLRPHRHLGNPCGRDAGQRDDPCRPRPQGARRAGSRSSTSTATRP